MAVSVERVKLYTGKTGGRERENSPLPPSSLPSFFFLREFFRPRSTIWTPSTGYKSCTTDVLPHAINREKIREKAGQQCSCYRREALWWTLPFLLEGCILWMPKSQMFCRERTSGARVGFGNISSCHSSCLSALVESTYLVTLRDS